MFMPAVAASAATALAVPGTAQAQEVTKRMSFDAQKDFVPVSLVGTAPLFLAVNARVKANTLEELVMLAKSRPGALNYGSAGIGSIGTPPEAIRRLNAEIAKVVKSPSAVEPLRAAGIEPIGGTPQQLAVALRMESERVARAAKRANLQAE
jgi:tripartite-type tricarboxylate transporter receptor subunit TctC